jgi:hypothetical protein
MSNESPAAIIFDELGNPVGVTNADDGYYRLQVDSATVKIIPTVSGANSTTTPLGAGATFSGSSEDVSGFVSADITVLSDVASAAGGLLFEWSQDNITFDYSESFSILAGVGSFYSLSARAKYFRLSYTNGAAPQTSFALSTVYYPINRSVFIQNLDTDVPAQKAVEVVRSVLTAQKTGGINNNYTNLQATTGGVLRVSVDTTTVPPLGPAAAVQQINTGPTSGTSFSQTIADTVLGNALIVLVMQGQGSAGATYNFFDSQGNLYTQNGSVKTPGVGQIDLWSTITQNGPCTVTADNFSSVSTVVLQCYEVSGLLSSAHIFDQISTNTGVGASLSAGSVTTNYDGEFCIAAFATSGSSTITAGAGWTQDLSVIDFGSESQTQSVGGILSGIATATPSVPYVGLLATFFPALTSRPLVTNSSGQLITLTEITDGYGNGPVAVAPPFTSATAAQPALVVAFSPNTPLTVTEARPSVNTTHSVAASLTNVSLLSSNSIRLGATLYNDSSSVLYVKLGTLASLTDFTIRLFPFCYYEIPYGYVGEIDGFWTRATGFARVGELTL